MNPVGPLFTISTINVARAAVREAEHAVSIDAPVDIRVGSHEPDGSARLYVEVSSHSGATQKIDVDDAAISACLAEQDYDAYRRMVNALVEELASEIKTVVRAQIARER
ncbi:MULTISPECIES: hypothetical protein [Bacteria]|uniref:hypothetical protein n=1 Tax=Bacteria TaxID=2 RepID=UPI00195BFFED|nr:hypothetical protein [Kocuria palustris]MBM7821764.1 hypothetical protein [Kocuria palustris]